MEEQSLLVDGGHEVQQMYSARKERNHYPRLYFHIPLRHSRSVLPNLLISSEANHVDTDLCTYQRKAETKNKILGKSDTCSISTPSVLALISTDEHNIRQRQFKGGKI